MKKAIATGLIGLIALGGSAVAVPAAFAQVDDDTTTSHEARQQERTERLETLVENGTLTQAEADEIQARFEERSAARAERRAEKIETLTSILGVTADDLQAAKDAGQSLADVAAAQGLSTQEVVDALVDNANARLDEKVAAGDIDAERAAEISDGLEERITARVNGERSEDGGRRGFGGPRGQRGPLADAGVGEA